MKAGRFFAAVHESAALQILSVTPTKGGVHHLLQIPPDPPLEKGGRGDLKRWICRAPTNNTQRGSSLVVVLIMLSVIFAIGIISAKVSLFSERSSRNDRDRQVAFQSAEATLLDAELDIFGPNTASNKRVCVFDSTKPAEFVEGCGTGTKTGMCLSTATPSEAWKTVKALYSSESGTGTTNQTVQYGQFTGQSLPVGAGLAVKAGRYTIEAVRYLGTGDAVDAVGSSTPEYAFVVTAMGFGQRAETQVILQSLVYKPANKSGSGC